MESDIVARLRVLASEFPTIERWMDNEWKNAADEIERLREERDEARRTACKGEAMLRLQRNRVHRDSEEVVRMTKEISVERGWDCFKENTDE